MTEDKPRFTDNNDDTITDNLTGLMWTQDASLVGGLVVRIGDTVYDGSVRHQLASLRERMEYGPYAANGAGS